MQDRLFKDYPAIEAHAKLKGDAIRWGDETAVVNTQVCSLSYAPIEKTPVTLAVGSTRLKIHNHQWRIFRLK